MVHQVYLGLGSNLGDREQNLCQAIRLIGERVGQVVRQSSFVDTEPWGFQSPHRFLNAVILCETARTPREVLLLTQQVEREMGRRPVHRSESIAHASDDGGQVSQPNRKQYHDRPIDIDILLYDDLTVNEPDLQIPHPLMHERDFVMIPLKEITNP